MKRTADEISEPPHCLPAEWAVLGELLRDVTLLDRIGELTESDFYTAAHRRVFRAILDCVEVGEPADMISVWERIERREPGMLTLADIGALMKASPGPANVRHHAATIIDRAKSRQLQAALTDCYELAGATAADKIDQAQARLMALTPQPQLAAAGMPSSVTRFRKTMAVRHSGEAKGIRTGFVDLDRKLRCLSSGELVVIAGRPSMGKSAFACQIAEATVKKSQPVLLLSMEMSAQQVMDRIVSGEANVPLCDIVSGDADGCMAIDKALERISNWPLTIDDSAALTLAGVGARARAAKRTGGLALLVIDYLQLMSGEGENRNSVIEEISRGLKRLAKELAIPVIALSQLSRKCDERTDRRPMLSDIRDSGAIEQDADIVLFVYREEAYRPGSPEWAGKAEILVRKHRQGATGDVRLTWREEYVHFANYHGDSWPSGAKVKSVRDFRA